MSNTYLSERRPRVLFFGMLGNFSYPSLQALIESGVDVCAVVLPMNAIPGNKESLIRQREQPAITARALPLLNSSLHASIVHLAWSKQIPVWEVQTLSDTSVVSTLATYEPDVICVACFSLRIPRAILDLPRLGCLNVHPSLLPDNRGPVPLFWAFRNDYDTTGVTIHYMEEIMDTGAILAQEPVAMPDGITYAQLEALCATRGGSLLTETMWKLYHGQAVVTPQDEARASYHSFPTAKDFVVPVRGWDARHVYNFIRGAGHWDEPIELRVDEQSIFVRDVFSYSHGTTKSPHFPEQIEIACQTGFIVLSL